LEKQWYSEIPNIKINAYQIDLNSLESIRQNIHLIREKNVTIDTIVANAAVGCDYGEKIPSH
jgi:short-subunit dehydrogenase